MAAEQIEAIRAVHQAALGLTLACTEYVGPVPMALSLPAVGTIGEPLPRPLRRDVAAIARKEVKR